MADVPKGQHSTMDVYSIIFKHSSVEPVKYTRYSKLPVAEPDEANPFEDEDDDDEMLK